MRVEELDTPAVTVDLDVMEQNIHRLQNYCREHGLALRPHTKTHKIPEIAKKQVEAGSRGITVAKVGEAEVMAEAGLDNILIAYPVLGTSKLERLTKLAQMRRVNVALDSEEAMEGISTAANDAGCHVEILIEYDMGLNRCGVQSVAEFVMLAQAVEKSPGVGFSGMMFYPGHIWDLPPDQGPALRGLGEKIQEIQEALKKAGLASKIISGGSTPTAFNSHLVQGLTEMRPGTYVFNDMNEVRVGACQLPQCALKVEVTVVSNAVKGKAMIDGGSKTFSSDRLISGDRAGFGYITEYPEIKFESMSEEHGHLDLSRSSYRPQVGEKLTIVPNHVCACVNMHDQIYYHRQGVVEGAWKIEGRGKVR